MTELPHPIDGTEVYLAAIHRRLGEILDRLPAEPIPPVGHVDLREPAAVNVPVPVRPVRNTRAGQGAPSRSTSKPKTTKGA